MTAPADLSRSTAQGPAVVGVERGTPAGAAVPPLIVGLDLSLAGTGVAHLRGTTLITELIVPPRNRATGHPRLRWIRTTVAGLCKGAALVVVEGPSYGSTGAGSHDRAGLWHMVRDRLWDMQVPLAIAPPSSVKKYALGVGGGKRAGKDQMLSAAVRRWETFDGDNNCADAAFCAAAGAHWLTGSSVIPSTHPDALDGMAWPPGGRP